MSGYGSALEVADEEGIGHGKTDSDEVDVEQLADNMKELVGVEVVEALVFAEVDRRVEYELYQRQCEVAGDEPDGACVGQGMAGEVPEPHSLVDVRAFFLVRLVERDEFILIEVDGGMADEQCEEELKCKHFGFSGESLFCVHP